VGSPLPDLVSVFLDGRESSRDPRHRQRLYPVVAGDGTLRGVITRRDVLDEAVTGRTDGLVDGILSAAPTVAYPTETLRTVAYRMADSGFTRLPVVAARDDRRLVGLITLPQLLEGRLRDLREARQAERVLTLPIAPLVRARRRPGARARTGADSS
jgi:predicted transcriptional regulator